MSTERENTQSDVNVSATSASGDTPVAQSRSADVRSTIPALIARRNKVGSGTPIGRRLSTVVEQIQNGVSVGKTIF